MSALRLLSMCLLPPRPASRPGGRSLPVREVDRAPQRDEPGLLDRLRQRRVRGHAVGDRLDRRFGVERDDAGLDEVGDVRPDHDDSEQLAVARLVDRLHPAHRLVLHHRAAVRGERERPDEDVVTVLLARLALRQADARDLRVRVDGARDGAVVHDRLVADRVLGRHLALAERGVGELPVAGAVADRVDVRDGRAPVLVRGDAVLRVEVDAERLEPDVLRDRAAPRGDEHEVALDRLAAEVHLQAVARVLDPVALRLEVDGDAALLELLRERLGGVLVLLRDERGEHLDDRHLAPEPLQDGGELAADDPAAEDDDALRHVGLREKARRVDAALGLDAVDRRAQRVRPGRDDRALEGHVLPAVHGERVGVFEAALALDPLDAVGLEEAGDAVRELAHDGRLPLVRLREVELGRAHLDAELLEGLLGLLNGKGGLHPRLRRDAADPEARAPERVLLLDAHGLGAQLGGPDRRGVAARASAEDGDVTFHVVALSVRFAYLTAILSAQARRPTGPGKSTRAALGRPRGDPGLNPAHREVTAA